MIEQYERVKQISSRGLLENIGIYVEKCTGERSWGKFFWQRTLLSLFSSFPMVAGTFLRGKVYRALLGSIGSLCYLEAHIKFNLPQRVFLGERVIIGEGCWFDLVSLESKIKVGDEAKIARFCTFKAGPGNIDIGEGANFGPFCLVSGYGGVEIGKYTQIASHVVILSYTHDMDKSMPIKFQETPLKKVTIQEDVWVGAQVVVLPGVTIGTGSIIGAGAVVSKDIPEYSIAAGVPAKVVGKRE